MAYVIRRIPDHDDRGTKWARGNWYVSTPGSASAYTQSLRNAAMFATEADALASQPCGNERVERADYP